MFGTACSSSSFAAEAPLPPAEASVPEAVAGNGTVTAVFAGGCFWGIEAVFEHVKGVVTSRSGYTGGKRPSPSYEQVTSGATGHAESVEVVYDPKVVTYNQLLQIFFSVHDPTQLNRQGPDVGTHYRSAIFYADDAQKKAAEAYIAQLTKAKSFRRPIVTEVVKLDRFWLAEDYHQNYASLHPNQPYIVIHDAPKIQFLKENFPALYREKRAD